MNEGIPASKSQLTLIKSKIKVRKAPQSTGNAVVSDFSKPSTYYQSQSSKRAEIEDFQKQFHSTSSIS